MQTYPAVPVMLVNESVKISWPICNNFTKFLENWRTFMFDFIQYSVQDDDIAKDLFSETE